MGILAALLIILRISWWPSPPSPSEDVWRYLWDGQRAYLGLSVFSEAPGSAVLQLTGHQVDPILLSIFPKIGHAEVPTVYPPGAQLFFWGSSSHWIQYGDEIEPTDGW